MCENQSIRYSNGVIEPLTKEQIQQLYKNRDFYLKKQIRRELIILQCGKCKYCKSLKQSKHTKLVDIEFKRNRYNYLITITLNDNHIDILDTQDNYYNYSKVAKSKVSNLSKIKINNIIKNLKNKLNRYYQQKIKLNYYLCGEYGSNTFRAHYHILIMIDQPLPNLIKQNVKGEHYKCSLLQSKQYGLYDIEPITSHNIKSVSKYISKYISKQENTKGTLKYNYFMEQQLKYYLQNNISTFYIVKKEEQLFKLMLGIMLNRYDLIKDIELIEPQYMKEFIKKSKGLGLFDLELTNLENGTLNNYYKTKIKLEYETLKWSVEPNLFYLQLIRFYYLQHLLFKINEYRILNIFKYSLKYDNIKRDKSIFKERRDIF